MRSSLKLLISTIAGAVASALYWVILFQAVYSLSAQDYAPDVPEHQTSGILPLLLGIGGFVLYVVAAWLWRRMEMRWMTSPEAG